jgi:hypothetical protein
MAPNFGHGHADGLSLQLRIGGAPALIDPGTFGYGGEARWRSYFRSTAAHNTVTVDGRSQAKEAGPFLWATSYTCELLHLALEPERAAILVARHDGYEPFGVRHTRAVKIVPGFVFVLDRLEGAGAHELCLRWHFAGAVRAADGAHVLDGPAALRCIAAGGAAQLFAGSETPPSGWRSDRYGVKQPVSTLELRCFVKLPHEFATGFALAAGNGGDLELQARALGQLLDVLSGAEHEPGGAATASPLKRAAAAPL